MSATAKPDGKIAHLDALKNRDGRWYLKDYEADRAKRLTTVARAIRTNDLTRQRNYLRYWALYANTPMTGLTPRRYTQRDASQARERLALNVVRSCSDSFVAKLTSQKPRVSCMTTGGDWDLQQRAEMLETFLDGMFYETDLYETAPLVALDMAVFGTGTVKIYAEDDGEAEHIVIERVMPGETFVDDEEAYDGKPRTRYQRKYVDRLVAMALYPKVAEQLATVARETEEDQGGEANGERSQTDTICIVEGWHLPSRAGAEDGRHTLACGDVIIFDEPWDKAYFPFVDLYRQRPQCGIWGAGLAEELQGLQFEINVILNMIRRAMRMAGTLRWFVPNGSNINTQYISDLIGSIIRFDGQAPTPITPPAAAPEVYQQLVFLYGKAFEISGVSQLSATSMAPGFEESGKAKELRLDTESERFSVAFGQYQLFFLKIARQVIALAREIGESNEKFKIKAVAKGRVMDVVKWADIHLEDEQFLLQMYQTNALARDPSSRLNQITEAVNAGTMNPKTGARLTAEMPDLAEEASYENASYDLTMQMVTDMLEHGQFQPPEPMMNLDVTKPDNSITVVQNAYLKARRSKVPEDRLELLRRWLKMAHDMTTPPPTPPTGPATPAPPGAPHPPTLAPLPSEAPPTPIAV